MKQQQVLCLTFYLIPEVLEKILNLEYYKPKVILFIKIMQNSSVTTILIAKTMTMKKYVTRTEKNAFNAS